MKPTRREILRALSAVPLCAVNACACHNKYPLAEIAENRTRRTVDDILRPTRLNRRVRSSVIDAHAHFFNASDVPVRGFIAESIGHNVDPRLQPLLREMAVLGERFAELAPTAAEELAALEELSATMIRSNADQQALDLWFRNERDRAAERVADVVGGTGFERRYREIVPTGRTRYGDRGITAQEVKEADDIGSPNDPRVRVQVTDVARKAKAFLQFLRLMLSYRASNVRTYSEAFSPNEGSGVDLVLSALVDFDYWLECPPRSAHEDQIALHLHLAAMHGGYLHPVAGYNPWTDIEQRGAGLRRVIAAWDTGVFVGVKIYPPTGFMPAGNALGGSSTEKRRPDLKQLDETLKAFFEVCANRGIPVIAHAARSNGRDAVHDDFSSPAAWDKLLCAASKESKPPVISLGHFGGDNPKTQWTAGFANLMKSYPNLRLFADIGYWDQLVCEESSTCADARNRLREVISIPLGGSETIADRVMFATDWLMLSQVPGWKAYAERVRAGLTSIADAESVVKIMGDNARKFFTRIDS